MAAPFRLRELEMRYLISFALAVLLALPARAETITLRADLWCPYNCEPGQEPAGYLIDIAKAVFEPAGATIDYQLMPYDDAIEAVRAGKVTAVVGAAKKDAPDLIFTGASEGYSSYAFASHKGSGFAYTGPQSLKGKRLGMIANYTYDDALDAYIAANKDTPAIVAVSGDNATQDLVMLLAQRKVDLIIESDAVLEYTIEQMKLSNLFDLNVASDGAPVYVAFSPADPKGAEYAKRLEEGVETLRKSGKLAEILRKYGLKDWARK